MKTAQKRSLRYNANYRTKEDPLTVGLSNSLNLIFLLDGIAAKTDKMLLVLAANKHNWEAN